MEITSNPHIAIIPTPGIGHLIPLLEFAKKLLHLHDISATFLIPNEGQPLTTAQKTFLLAIPPGISYISLPPVNLDDLPSGTKIETRISHTVARSLPSVRHVVESLNGTQKLVALVADLFATDVFDIGIQLKIPVYLFFPPSASSLSLALYLPELEKTVSFEFSDAADKIQIPGCIPIERRDLPDPMQDRNDEAYGWMLHHIKRYRMADGLLVNSFKELEPGAIEVLQQQESGKPPVYPIGPLILTGSKSDDPCLKWLDEQPTGSVLYVSFGSGGTLSQAQITEIALGLEKSEQRFLWVIRCPNDRVSNAAYFDSHNSDDPLAYLPEKFIERTKNRGLLVPMWAPQAQILAHDSVSGFLTHCGWNSVLESVVNGVPLIAWPLYAEQKMNAFFLDKSLKVALRPKMGGNGLVERDEICSVVKGLMEGEEGERIRSRMGELKDSAAKVLGENGSCLQILGMLGEKWKNDVQ
ncbi:hydroquinone glucosyltransferase-like [Primulina huaijiensis]|uniref:hydroquinone glucosyltransferase-like n=1 Tax=Primulina huaijiensis TaxID=1492673 RepID=UPI003CC779BC